MNRKEKMAACILVFTLAAGILTDLLQDRLRGDREPGNSVPAEAVADSSGSIAEIESLPAAAPGVAQAVGGAEAEEAGGGSEYRRIDINRAGLAELELLPGIGPKKAEAIVQWRSEHGRFARLEDLLEVKGIGRATLERLRPFASIGE